MNAYIYQAALYCEECGEAIKTRLDPRRAAHINPDNEYTYDSDEYPKGPYDNGGGEADYPCHCGACNVFLQNPLTTDGERYVREQAEEDPDSDVIKEWLRFYDYIETGPLGAFEAGRDAARQEASNEG